MSKKKPSPPEDSGDFFGVQPRRKPVRKGRPLVLPEGFEANMDDFIQHSDAWIRRFKEVWFMGPERPLECPRLAGMNEGDVLECYAEAIETLGIMTKLVKDGQICLEQGQAFAKEVLANMKNPPEQSSDVPELDEEQCSVMDELKNL